jgi:3',5'-cyclic AMP phosphodiesterase CpdA
MINLVHLSDVHFGREVPKVINGLTEALHELQPERIIISGDLTQRAKHSEFSAFNEFRDSLPAPCFIVPGNHDLSAHRLIERFIYPWRKWRRYVNAELEPTLSTDDYLAIGKNTARRMGWYMDWSRGRINDGQIADVHTKVDAADEHQLRFLVAHHPFWLPATYEFRRLIGSRDEALEEFSAAGLDMIMSGHVHMAYAEVVKGVIISHAGTTLSDRLLPDQPNSFNRITGDRDHLVIELFEWNGEHFASHSQQHFKRTEHGWTRETVN